MSIVIKKNITLALALVAVFIFSAVGSYLLFARSQDLAANKIASDKNNTQNASDSAAMQVAETKEELPLAIALLGYGGAGHDGGGLTDSIIVARVDEKNQKIYLINIPRDLWIKIPSDQSQSEEEKEKFGKINMIYSAGGGELAKTVLSDVLGMTVTNFVAVDFAGFIRIIDAIGGIDVVNSVAFDDPYYPLEGKATDTCGKSPEQIAATNATLSGFLVEREYTCRYETLSFSKGTIHLDGISALKYSRSRHSATSGGDFNRASRQKAVLVAVKNKIFSKNLITNSLSLLVNLSKSVRTDLALTDVDQLSSTALNYKTYEVINIDLSDKNVLRLTTSSDRQSILVPKEGEGFEFIHNYLEAQQNELPL